MQNYPLAMCGMWVKAGGESPDRDAQFENIAQLIERRFFPHISRACTGMLFDTLERVVALMRKATTSTGLRTTVNVIKKIYGTGRNATDIMKATIRETVSFHDILPKWNYTITPQIGQ